jgi:hypothetical protein
VKLIRIIYGQRCDTETNVKCSENFGLQT